MGYTDFVVERYIGAKKEPENRDAEDIPFYIVVAIRLLENSLNF